MGFDPSKSKTTSEERKADARARAEGVRNRQACVDALADLFTDPHSPFSSEQLRECRAVLHYLEPDVRQMFDSIARRYSEPKEREMLRGVLLATAIESVNRVLA
jgi:hypothetical protein